MLFNSIQFFVFFAVVCTVYAFCSYVVKRNTVTQLFLLLSSLFFYACWKPAYLCLILLSVCITYAGGIAMERWGRRKRLLLVAVLCSNLLILFFFKYFNFFAGNFNKLSKLAGFGRKIPSLKVLLPVGISFYTFQALGYAIDVCRGTVKAERNFVTYALFVTFFPQLVAGPIERTDNLLPQFKADYRFDYNRVTDGIRLIAWGVFLKIVVADRCAQYVDPIYNGDIQTFTGLQFMLATLFFAVQVYADFNGYSTIAVGVAKILGFTLMDNFRRPYFSKNTQEFWRRWHISLGSWFRDYLYFPLGGSRCSSVRHYANILAVMLVSGLWHGAQWHFVAWGVLLGVYQVVGIATRELRRSCRTALHLEDETGVVRFWQVMQTAMTFCMICTAWIFFRAPGFMNALRILKRLPSVPRDVYDVWRNWMIAGTVSFPVYHAVTVLCIAVLFVVSVVTKRERGSDLVKRFPAPVRWFLYLSLIVGILFLQQLGETEFLYFQF